MPSNDLDGERRVLAHLPPWRAPSVAKAWAEHEIAHGGITVATITAGELTARIQTHDPNVSFKVNAHTIRGVLEDLRGEGLARVDRNGGWSQTQAGLDLLTDGNAKAHSQRIAAAIAKENS